jgi:hypothetical protein
MRMLLSRNLLAKPHVFSLIASLAAGCLVLDPVSLRGQGVSTLMSKDEARQFLLTAKVIKSATVGKGVTDTWRLTLTDGKFTHDASFQDVDVRTQEAGFAGGGRELNFADSFHYNIAAYEVARLLEIDDMVPITVERAWEARKGSLSWWVDDVRMDEDERQKQGITPPDSRAWNGQMHRVRVFYQLIYDTDRNPQNILITGDWRIWLIDFSRAFRTLRRLPEAKDLVKCERGLYLKLVRLSKDEVAQAVGPHLTRWELEALMSRRDLIVSHFKKLISAQGEAEVLY